MKFLFMGGPDDGEFNEYEAPPNSAVVASDEGGSATYRQCHVVTGSQTGDPVIIYVPIEWSDARAIGELVANYKPC